MSIVLSIPEVNLRSKERTYMEGMALQGLGRMFDYADAGTVAGGNSAKTVRGWTKRKSSPLPTIRIGHNTVRIAESHLVAWLQSLVRS
jgi:hypothetical protein